MLHFHAVSRQQRAACTTNLESYMGIVRHLTCVSSRTAAAAPLQ
jgi:hypothetical protein